MARADCVSYLEHAGFHYKPAESPDLWSHLESHFGGRQAVGPKFTPMPSVFMTELIAMGEEALLEAMVAHHRQTGALGRVARVIDLPYIVGTGAAVPLARADKRRVLHLVADPGTLYERLVHVIPVEADEIPTTSRVTVTGGLYPDGHTAGYYDLTPGDQTADVDAASDEEEARAWLATRDEIATLAREMELGIDDIVTITRRECEVMVERAKKTLKQVEILS